MHFELKTITLVGLIPLFILVHSTFPIMVPENDLEVYHQESPSSKRRFIIEDTTLHRRRGGSLDGRRFLIEDVADRVRQREEFLKSTSCVNNFLLRYIENPAWTSFMILHEDKEIQDFIQSLTTSLDSKFAFFKPSTDSSFGLIQRAFSTVILMQNASSLTDSLYILEPCDRGCPFVNVLTTTYQDEQTFLDEADVVIQSMWTKRIAKVIVLAKVGDSVLAAGSLKFQSNSSCVPSSPVVLDECADGSWNKMKRIRSPRLNECILKVAYFEQSPHVIVANGSERLMGYEGNLIEEVMKNQPIERERVEWNDNASYAEQVQMFLYNDVTADLVVGGVLQQSSDNVDYSATYDMLKMVWLIPKVPNVSLKGLIQPFDSYVWAAVGGSLVLGGVIKIFLSRDLSWLDIFALIIGVSTARQPNKLSSKIQFLSWSVFGLFLTQVYVDSLADQLINVSDLKIETMKELMLSSFKIGGTAAVASVFDGFEDSDGTISQIREKFIILDQDTYLKLFQDLLAGRNNSFALVAVLNSSRSDAIDTVYAYTMTTETICSFPLVLATWKGFPYMHRINNKVLQLIDYGFLDFMIRMAIAKEVTDAEDEEYKSELHLQQFVPAFLLTFMGYFGGFVLFVVEIIFYPCKILE